MLGGFLFMQARLFARVGSRTAAFLLFGDRNVQRTQLLLKLRDA